MKNDLRFDVVPYPIRSVSLPTINDDRNHLSARKAIPSRSVHHSTAAMRYGHPYVVTKFILYQPTAAPLIRRSTPGK